MKRLDVESFLIGRLSEALPGTTVMGYVPDPRPERLLVVQRRGGAHTGVLLDHAGIHVQAWGATEQEAFDTLSEASEVILALPSSSFAEGLCRVEEESFRLDPDPQTDLPRYFASYTITTYDR